MRYILLSSLALARAHVKVETDEVQARVVCIESNEVDTGFKLNLSMSTGTENSSTFSVPGLNSNITSYKYATDNALVALPAQCALNFAANITKAAVLPNKNQCDPQGMKYVRISDIEGTWDTLAKMTNCSQGLVIGFHGSGGPGWGQVQYAIIFSGLGYIHVQLDSMASDNQNLKGRAPQAGEDISMDNYCGAFSASNETCSKFSKPYCYTSEKDVIVAQADTYRKYMEGVFQIRKREMDDFVDEHEDFLDAFSTIYAVGNSEGAMILNRYWHEDFTDKLKGMIFDGWSCEFNYFVPCADAARICEDKCKKSIPVLNMIGDEDESFGVISTSMAQKVKADADGYGADTITGNCNAQFVSQSFDSHTTVVFKGAGHTPKYWSDNLVRAVVLDFIGNKSQSWKSKYGCSETAGTPDLFECDNPEELTCNFPAWDLNTDETCECCPAPAPAPDSRSTKYTVLASYLMMSLFCAHVW